MFSVLFLSYTWSPYLSFPFPLSSFRDIWSRKLYVFSVYNYFVRVIIFRSKYFDLLYFFDINFNSHQFSVFMYITNKFLQSFSRVSYESSIVSVSNFVYKHSIDPCIPSLYSAMACSNICSEYMLNNMGDKMQPYLTPHSISMSFISFALVVPWFPDGNIGFWYISSLFHLLLYFLIFRTSSRV